MIFTLVSSTSRFSKSPLVSPSISFSNDLPYSLDKDGDKSTSVKLYNENSVACYYFDLKNSLILLTVRVRLFDVGQFLRGKKDIS